MMIIYTQKEADVLFDLLFTLKMSCEDMIDLAKAGFPHGYKKGVVEKRLKQVDKTLLELQEKMKESDNG